MAVSDIGVAEELELVDDTELVDEQELAAEPDLVYELEHGKRKRKRKRKGNKKPVEEPKLGEWNPDLNEEGSYERQLQSQVFEIDERYVAITCSSVESAFSYSIKRRQWNHWGFVYDHFDPSSSGESLLCQQATFRILEDFPTHASDCKPTHLLEPLDPYLRQVVSEARAQKYWCHIPRYSDRGRNNRSKSYLIAGIYDCANIWSSSISDIIREKLTELKRKRQLQNYRIYKSNLSTNGDDDGGSYEGDDDIYILNKKVAVLQCFVSCFIENPSLEELYGHQDEAIQPSTCSHKTCLLKNQNEKVLRKLSKHCLFDKRLGTFPDVLEFLEILQDHRTISCPLDAFRTLRSDSADHHDTFFEDPELCRQIEATDYHINSIGDLCKRLQTNLGDHNCELSPSHERLLQLSTQPRRIRHSGAKAIHLVTHGTLPTNLKTIMDTAIFSSACYMTLRYKLKPASGSEVDERRAFVADLRRWKKLVKPKDLDAYLDATYALWGSYHDRVDWLRDNDTAERYDGWFVDRVVKRLADEFDISMEDVFCSCQGDGNRVDEEDWSSEMPGYCLTVAELPKHERFGGGCFHPVAHRLGQDFPFLGPFDSLDYHYCSATDALRVLIAGLIVLYALCFFQAISGLTTMVALLEELTIRFSQLPDSRRIVEYAFVRDVIDPLVNLSGINVVSELQQELWTSTFLNWIPYGIFRELKDVYLSVIKLGKKYLSSNANLLREFISEARELFDAFEASAYGTCLRHKCKEELEDAMLLWTPIVGNEEDAPFSPAPPTPSPLTSISGETTSREITLSPAITRLQSSTPSETLSDSPGNDKLVCQTCGNLFTRSQNLLRHQREAHPKDPKAPHVCNLLLPNGRKCGKVLTSSRKSNRATHERRVHGGKIISPENVPRQKRRRIGP